MIKLFIGGKGTGKTKTLIDLCNNAANESKGSVVCIEKGEKLRTDITYKTRLIDTDTYFISDAEALYGFISGILASNSDITDFFVDGTLKICNQDLVGLEKALNKLDKITKDINFFMTVSIPADECPAGIKAFA